jgi:hypothetical protein
MVRHLWVEFNPNRTRTIASRCFNGNLAIPCTQVIDEIFVRDLSGLKHFD